MIEGYRWRLSEVLKAEGWTWEQIAGTTDKVLLEHALDVLLDCWRKHNQQKAGGN